MRGRPAIALTAVQSKDLKFLCCYKIMYLEELQTNTMCSSTFHYSKCCTVKSHQEQLHKPASTTAIHSNLKMLLGDINVNLLSGFPKRLEYITCVRKPYLEKMAGPIGSYPQDYISPFEKRQVQLCKIGLFSFVVRFSASSIKPVDHTLLYYNLTALPLFLYPTFYSLYFLLRPSIPQSHSSFAMVTYFLL